MLTEVTLTDHDIQRKKQQMLEALQGDHKQKNLCRQMVSFMTMGWKTGDTNLTTRFTTGSNWFNSGFLGLTVPDLVLRYWNWMQKNILTQSQVLVRACHVAHSLQFIGRHSHLVKKPLVTFCDGLQYGSISRLVSWTWILVRTQIMVKWDYHHNWA